MFRCIKINKSIDSSRIRDLPLRCSSSLEYCPIATRQVQGDGVTLKPGKELMDDKTSWVAQAELQDQDDSVQLESGLERMEDKTSWAAQANSDAPARQSVVHALEAAT